MDPIGEREFVLVDGAEVDVKVTARRDFPAYDRQLSKGRSLASMAPSRSAI